MPSRSGIAKALFYPIFFGLLTGGTVFYLEVPGRQHLGKAPEWWGFMLSVLFFGFGYVIGLIPVFVAHVQERKSSASLPDYHD
jgi:hypothetical protein